jgi:antitoxin (DNA-binding transcriptional repressor) of toxin-antitoxin stability system
MKFISTRELRNRPGAVRELAQKEDLVLTADGKPIAILMGIENDDVEQAALMLRQARAQRALSRIRSQASRSGVAQLSARALEAEIRAVRRKRNSK